MKKITLLLLLACISIGTMHAQIKGNGYYRIQNAKTERYMSLTTTETRGISMQTTTVDCKALLTKKKWDDVSTDPGTIFYIENKGGGQYNIKNQGSSLYDMINYYIRLRYLEDANVYRAYQSKSGGTVYLSELYNKNTLGRDTCYVDNNTTETLNWKITAVDCEDNYLGVKPTMSANGKYYASYYAGFPFSVASPNMKVYYISSIDEKKGTATYKELTGIIPASTPVIIECGSKNPAENKLKPELRNPTAVKGNILKGVYFCVGFKMSGRFTSTKFEPTTMRLLSIDENGSLVFNNDEANAYTVMIKEGASRPKYPYIKAIPHNTAYLPVSANCPKSLKLVKETTGISNITLGNDNKPANVYNMEGKIVKENATSVEGLPEGIYIFKNKKYVVK